MEKVLKTLKFGADSDVTYIVTDADAQEQLANIKDWAKADSKPSYTADEVGALPSSTVIPSTEGLETSEHAEETYQVKGDYLTSSSLSSYLTKDLIETYYETLEHAEATYQAKGEYASASDLEGKLDLLPGDVNTGGNAYNLSYYFYTVPNAEKVTVHAKTISLDGKKVLGDYPLDVVGASDTLAGLMTAADKVKLDSAVLPSALNAYQAKGDYASQSDLESVQNAIKEVVVKNMVEKVCTARITANSYYRLRISGNNIDMTELQDDANVLATSGTGLVSFIRHIITNNTSVNTSISDGSGLDDNNTVTLRYTGIDDVVLNDDGMATESASIVAAAMAPFILAITGHDSTTTSIPQSELKGKVIDVIITTPDSTSVSYKLTIL